jgi:hypothetical protein
MNKYKQVSVYTGYGENSIQSTSVFGVPGNITDAGNHVEWYTQQSILQEDPSNLEYVKEFFTGVTVVDDIAFVAAGEENVTLVISEGNVWFDRVDNEDFLYDNLMDEWQELIDSQYLNNTFKC